MSEVLPPAPRPPAVLAGLLLLLLTGCVGPAAPLSANSIIIGADAVPYLAAHRYKSSGLKKHRAWQRTWDAQRAEDAWDVDSWLSDIEDGQ